jgi:hypothetical protein
VGELTKRARELVVSGSGPRNVSSRLQWVATYDVLDRRARARFLV